MLVLTRRVGETIVMDDNIRVTVLAISGRQIRLGINAPADVGIQRGELVGEVDRPFNPKAATHIARLAAVKMG